MSSFHLAFGAAEPFTRHSQHGYRRGGTFESPKVPKSDLGLRPKNPRTGTPARKGNALPERGLNGAYSVPQRIYPLPVPLPRGGGGAVYPNNRLFNS